jgi:hypothetical protein
MYSTYGRNQAILDFSALAKIAVWRSGRDSNPG